MVEAVPPRVIQARAFRPRPSRAALRRGVRRHALPALGAALLAVLLAGHAAATTVVAKSFEDLCAEADLVFLGTVESMRSAWSDPAKQAIETRITFGDLTWLRGGPRAQLTLRFAGGTVDGLSEEIAGMPRFAVGDRVVIFARDGTYVSPIVGFHQGLFRVDDGVVVDADGRALALHGAALRRSAPDATPGSGLSLAVFLERVRAGLAAAPRP
jgi:hypothetical protein